MADQTHGAVDSLLSLLSTAIKDEVSLLGGVQGDMQFIKDEMDSMNGFLLHLNKTECEHDDQLRAWMKQVRDISYIAQDCIERYRHDVEPQPKGFWAHVRRLHMLLWTLPARRSLAIKIRELKVRVRDVGERRMRYDVTVRSTALKQSSARGQDNSANNSEEARAAFLSALDGGDGHGVDIDKAISVLPHPVASAGTIRAILQKCASDRIAAKMFLCALYAYPHGTKKELKNLNKGTTDGMPAKVMLFCYSKLSTHYKSCLQYLTAFQKEDSISKTSLVRRWIAEGLVAREEGLQTLEQAAERCFDVLVFLGFVRSFETGTAGKVKKCRMDNGIWKFVINISKTDNFVGNDLPAHLKNQLAIRDFVKRQQRRLLQQKPPADSRFNALRRSMICDGLCTRGRKPQAEKEGEYWTTTQEGSLDPLDEMVLWFKSLDINPLYRLNVVDLGGCRGLGRRHLKTVCKVLSLKYLSLRNTDVSRLPRQINNLKLLETLDIRQTDVRATDTDNIFLPNLKHLLAGRRADVPTPHDYEQPSSLTTVRIPRKIGAMRHVEILSHVQVGAHGDDAELDALVKLTQLRKLGVVLTGSSQETIARLPRIISRLYESLLSLSICRISSLKNNVVENGTFVMNMGPTEPHPKMLASLSITCTLGIQGLPNWCHDLKSLSKVTLCGTSLPVSSLRILGKLEGLRCLRLRRHSFVETTLTFQADEFQNLKFLLMEDTMINCIKLQPGTTPKIDTIVCFTNTDTSDMVPEISHRIVKVELPNPYPVRQAVAALPTGVIEDAGEDRSVG